MQGVYIAKVLHVISGQVNALDVLREPYLVFCEPDYPLSLPMKDMPKIAPESYVSTIYYQSKDEVIHL